MPQAAQVPQLVNALNAFLDKTATFIWCGVGAVCGVAFIVLLGAFSPTAWASVAGLLLVSLASLICGTGVGLLFGLPKYTPRAAKTDDGSAAECDSDFEPNSNLYQVSDWLTKIIVGLSLVEFRKMYGYLDQAATLSAGLLGTLPGAKAVCFAIILAFAGLGFWIGYMFGVAFLPKIMSDARIVRAAKEIVRAASTDSLQARTGSIPPFAERESRAEPDGGVKRGPNLNDPWKGAFGGSAELNHRRLSASVEAIGETGYFRVTLVVQSTDRKAAPLVGPVFFYIHPSFRREIREVAVASDGKATLGLVAWGAFTVGALADSGQTRLELDLAQLEDAPALFRSR